MNSKQKPDKSEHLSKKVSDGIETRLNFVHREIFIATSRDPLGHLP
jgi:hypothetical protein